METREGQVTSYDNSKNEGQLLDSITGENRTFANPAKVSISVGSGIIYISITVTPLNGVTKIINIFKEVKNPG